MGGDLDGVVIPKVEQTPAVAAVAPAVETPPAPPPPTAEAPQPAAPAQPTAPTADEVVNTPEGFLQSFEASKDAMINIFAERTFALSDEDKQALVESPETIIPNLMGRVLFAAASSAQRLMMEQLPFMIQNHLSTTKGVEESQSKFFDAFADLKDPKYRADLQRYADFYRAQYPQSTLEERIQAVGTWGRMHFKLPAPAAASPAAPVAAPSQVVARQVFQPAAAAGGAARGAPVPVDDDPFAGAMLDYGD